MNCALVPVNTVSEHGCEIRADAEDCVLFTNRPGGNGTTLSGGMSGQADFRRAIIPGGLFGSGRAQCENKAAANHHSRKKVPAVSSLRS